MHPGFTNTDLQVRSVHETGGGRSQRFFPAAADRSDADGPRALLLLRQPPT